MRSVAAMIPKVVGVSSTGDADDPSTKVPRRIDSVAEPADAPSHPALAAGLLMLGVVVLLVLIAALEVVS